MFPSWLSKEKHSENSVPEKGFRTQTFYLGQCQAFEKTCHCSSLTCLTMPKEGLLLFPAVMHSTKQNLPPGNRPWNLIQAHLPLWWGCSKPAEGLCKQSEWVTFQWVWQLLPREWYEAVKSPIHCCSTAKSPNVAAQPRLEIPTLLCFKSFWAGW